MSTRREFLAQAGALVENERLKQLLIRQIPLILTMNGVASTDGSIITTIAVK